MKLVKLHRCRRRNKSMHLRLCFDAMLYAEVYAKAKIFFDGEIRPA